MSDIGDDFALLRKMRQEKRASNRENSAQLLTDAGIHFESKNGGAHLIVSWRFDFWPGTGLWIKHHTKQRNYGVRGLIAFLRNNPHLMQRLP